MGSKQEPGAYDCYANALPDEPMFVLLARDPDFYRLVMKWARRRTRDIDCGLRPATDWPMVSEAISCAAAGEKWCRLNQGAWRRPKDTPAVVLQGGQ
jgi:hypothetical protein